MTKITCDKCEKDITLNKRTVSCAEGYLFLAKTVEKEPHDFAISEIELCVECKDELGKVIQAWL